MDKKVLVLNMGMKSIRSIVFDQSGNKLASAASPLSTGLSEDRVFQDPEEWWTCAVKVIRKTLKDINWIPVDYLTVTASSACLVYTDAYYCPLDASIMVSDKRDSKEAELIAKMEERGAFQTEDGSSGTMLSKILWVKNNQPNKFRTARWFLSPNDFLVAKLTGRSVTDEFNALKYHYNIKKKHYEDALFELGIDVEKLPEVVPAGTIAGPILVEVANQMGLSEATQVIVSSYDAICSFFGSGVAQEGEASDVSGTVTVLRALTYKNSLTASARVFVIPYEQKNCHIVGGSNNLGGGLIEWGKQCYYNFEQYPYEVMEKEAQESLLGARGLLFMPYLLGERAPIWDQTVRGMFFGIERYHTRKDMIRAIFESTGFIDLDFVNAIESTGVQIKSIRASGGLARINLINQIKADVTGKEVKVLDEFETTATGAAMIVFEAMGVFSNMQEASDVFSNVRMIVRPNWKNHQKYQEMYRLYQCLYQETKDIFRMRRDLIEKLYQEQECVIENL